MTKEMCKRYISFVWQRLVVMLVTAAELSRTKG